jgi:hypothetical protein
MCADRSSECHHHVDEKEYLRGCNRAAYGLLGSGLSGWKENREKVVELWFLTQKPFIFRKKKEKKTHNTSD